jgi:hypothetical protein
MKEFEEMLRNVSKNQAVLLLKTDSKKKVISV